MPFWRTVPAPILLLIASFLAPTELSLYLGGLRLPLHRVVLILLFVPALLRILTRRDIRIHAFDVLFVLFNIWTVAVFNHHGGMPDGQGGQSDGLVFGGSLALESLGAYIVARAWVRDIPTFRATIKALFAALCAAFALSLPETLLGQHFTHDLLQSLTGYQHPRALETRAGLTRAYGTFDHPIHLGTFCASLFALVWVCERSIGTMALKLAVVCLATITAMSSAPLLCIGLQVALLIWERVTRGMPARVGTALGVFTLLYVLASLAGTRTPIAILATGMTLDSWTGYYRLVIWEHGTANVLANPWLGIGLADWERPAWMVAATVDAFWLLIAMRTGLPAIIMLLLAILLLVLKAGRKGAASRQASTRRLTRGWLIALVALCLAACTVHLWNAIYAYFFFFVGMGAVFADPVKEKKVAARRSRASPSVLRPGRASLASIGPMQPVAYAGAR